MKKKILSKKILLFIPNLNFSFFFSALTKTFFSLLISHETNFYLIFIILFFIFSEIEKIKI
jgi:hypothetical protein